MSESEPLTAKALLAIAIEWMRERWPDAVIVPELSVADWGGARIDVAAITPTHIAGVEIKGCGDSPARLPLQGLAYGMVAREMWLLACPTIAEKCWRKRPGGWGKLEIREAVARPATYPKAVIRGHLCPTALCGTLWKKELIKLAAKFGVSTGSFATVESLANSIEDALPAPTIHDEMISLLRKRKWGQPKCDQIIRPSIGDVSPGFIAKPGQEALL